MAIVSQLFGVILTGNEVGSCLYQLPVVNSVTDLNVNVNGTLLKSITYSIANPNVSRLLFVDGAGRGSHPEWVGKCDRSV